MSNENAMLSVIAGLRAEIKLLREKLHTKKNELRFGEETRMGLAEENNELRANVNHLRTQLSAKNWAAAPTVEAPAKPPKPSYDVTHLTGASLGAAWRAANEWLRANVGWEPYRVLNDPRMGPAERWVILMRLHDPDAPATEE